MRLLVLDTEATGTDTTSDKVIEIAGVLLDVPNRSIVASYSTLLYEPENPAEHINHISTAALSDPLARDRLTAMTPFLYLYESADVIIAHNSEFDRPMTERLLERELGGAIPPSLKKPWACSLTQIRYPAYPNDFPGKQKRKLVYIALDHGIVSTGGLHRAMPDALLLTQLLCLIPDLAEQIDRAKGERVMYAVYPPAPEPRPGEFGLHWNPEKRRWQRLLNEREASELPFHAERQE